MNSWTSPVDIRPDHLEIVQEILRAHLPAGFEVWVFGSRANWTTKDSSDLDLAVEGAVRLDHKSMIGLEVAFEESDLPYTVDVVDLKAVSSGFRQIVEDQRLSLPLHDQAGKDEWETASWGDLATLEYGKSLRGYESSEGPYRVYGTNGPIGWCNEPLCFHPSVIIGRKGAYRGVHYSATPFFVIDTAFYLRPKVEIDTRWAYYQLLTQDINGMDSGSAIPSTSREDFYGLPVKVPPLAEQRAIAHVLGTLDDKIELNRRMNRTLEEMARAIFQDWFVDFGPTRAKMERQKPYLPPKLWDLFPDQLVDSELGDIPDGWEVRPLSNFAVVVYGAAFAAKRFNESGKGSPLIRIRDLASHNPSVFTDEQHPKGQLIQPGYIVVGMDGEFRAHTWKGPPSWLNQRVCHFQPRQDVPRQFLFESLIGPLADFERSKVGTTVIHLSKADIDSIRLARPPAEVFEAFASWTEPVIQQVVKNAAEARLLADQRDALLPKLLSGELA